MDKYDHMMVDIETLGNQSYALITNIAALRFNIDTGDIPDNGFFTRINWQSCIDAGLHIEAETMRWWIEQSEEARNKLLESEYSVDLPEALVNFRKFCDKTTQIWGNSARFDLGLLQNAYYKVGIPIPWDFRKERCLRTLVSFAPEVKDNWNFVGVKHDPIDDCKNQIGYCCDIWKHLNKRVT